VNWRDITQAFARNWRQSVADANGRLPQFSVIPIGGFEAGNVAIESVQILNPPVVQDVPVELEVLLHNYDNIPSAALTLSVGSSSYREQFRSRFSRRAGVILTVHCSITLPSSGQQTITSRIIPQSGLSFDDSL